MLTNEEMLDMVIRVRGFENRDTIWFAEWIEEHADAPYEQKMEMLDCALDDPGWDWDDEDED